MNRVQIEKLRLAKERDEQLDRLSGRYETTNIGTKNLGGFSGQVNLFLSMLRYEERLGELHSVIAELSRQLELKESEKIVEEEEPEGEEEEDRGPDQAKHLDEDNQDGMDPRTQSELASRTSTDIIDAQAVEVRNSVQLPYSDSESFIILTSGGKAYRGSLRLPELSGLQLHADARRRHRVHDQLQLHRQFSSVRATRGVIRRQGEEHTPHRSVSGSRLIRRFHCDHSFIHSFLSPQVCNNVSRTWTRPDVRLRYCRRRRTYCAEKWPTWRRRRTPKPSYRQR